jgi:hypothetical protein
MRTSKASTVTTCLMPGIGRAFAEALGQMWTFGSQRVRRGWLRVPAGLEGMAQGAGQEEQRSVAAGTQIRSRVIEVGELGEWEE